jgi:hypothetical protein
MNDNEPRNELEQQLLSAQAGRLSSEALLSFLLGAQVFLPVQDEVEPVLNIQRSTKARPLVLNAEDGTPVLVVFSSPERAKPFLQNYPGFGGGILVEFRWILENLGGGFAVALNPGMELGFDMEIETVGELARRLSEQRPA